MEANSLDGFNNRYNFNLNETSDAAILDESLFARASQRPAMCSNNKEQRVKPSTYFYSTIDLILGGSKTKTGLRTKKIVKAEELKCSEYKALKTEKAALFETLQKLLKINKVDSIFKRIKQCAEKGEDFKFIFDCQDSESKEKYSKFEKSCESLQQKSKEQRANLANVLDLDHLSPEEEKKLSRFSKDPDWNTSKLEIMKSLNEKWPNLYAELWEFISKQKSLKPNKMHKDFYKKFEGVSKHKSFSTIQGFIWNHLVKMKQNESNTSELESTIRDNNLIIESQEKGLKEEAEIIRKIFKEQKHHVFMRFCTLLNHYEDFLRHAKIIQNMADEMEPGMGDKVENVIYGLLQHSHYETYSVSERKTLQKIYEEAKLENYTSRTVSYEDYIANLKAKLDRIDQEAKLSTVRNNHHEDYIMGFEEPGTISEEKKIAAAAALERMLQISGPLNKFSRAHTLPFPGMFTWKKEKIKEFLAGNGLTVPFNFFFNGYITNEFFKAVIKNNAELLDQCFIEQLNLMKAHMSKEEFIYAALELMGKLHLRIFSETELMPDFVNTYLDALSESHTEGFYYKKIIAEGLAKCVKEPTVSLAERLKLYKEGTLKQYDAKMQEWNQNTSSLLSDKFQVKIWHTMLKIGAVQVKQALLYGWQEPKLNEVKA